MNSVSDRHAHIIVAFRTEFLDSGNLAVAKKCVAIGESVKCALRGADNYVAFINEVFEHGGSLIGEVEMEL